MPNMYGRRNLPDNWIWHTDMVSMGRSTDSNSAQTHLHERTATRLIPLRKMRVSQPSGVRATVIREHPLTARYCQLPGLWRWVTVGLSRPTKRADARRAEVTFSCRYPCDDLPLMPM
jgi:hypothetical protein